MLALTFSSLPKEEAEGAHPMNQRLTRTITALRWVSVVWLVGWAIFIVFNLLINHNFHLEDAALYTISVPIPGIAGLFLASVLSMRQKKPTL